MSIVAERQQVIRLYKEATGEVEIKMHDVVRFAIKMGYQLPQPEDPIDRAAKLFADAARQEIRRDKGTGHPYRANHAVPKGKDNNGQMVFFWIDIDDPGTTVDSFKKSAVMRREQMVDDGVQLSLDLDHWNGVRCETERVDLPWDLTMDIEIRKASLNGDDETEAA